MAQPGAELGSALAGVESPQGVREAPCQGDAVAEVVGVLVGQGVVDANGMRFSFLNFR